MLPPGRVPHWRTLGHQAIKHTMPAQLAVVNYHGSTGFGQAFLDSISHRWGELERQDIEAATTELLKRPYIDPQRVYASGGSYGGFMVAWMNGHLPGGSAPKPEKITGKSKAR